VIRHSLRKGHFDLVQRDVAIRAPAAEREDAQQGDCGGCSSQEIHRSRL
jgi:hypothetical protein